ARDARYTNVATEARPRPQIASARREGAGPEWVATLTGDVSGAARLLGRHYSVTGVVERGDARGGALGYPTINLGVAAHRLLPRDGIYAMWAHVNGARVPAAASLGVRPTFGGGQRRLEAYLLDWSGDVYGDTVRAEFVKRLRDELRFADAAELATQIGRDVLATRAALGEPARPPVV
ncbi:MAG: riboflavin kinase, partial [Chloroflexota bacterium]